MALNLPWARRAARLLLAVSMIAASLCATLGTAEAEPRLDIDEQLYGYALHANDAPSLRAALDRPRLLHADTEDSHALTEVVISSRLEVDEVDGGCRWQGPVVHLQLRTWLPDWIELAQAAAALRRQWNGVRHGLEVHEAGHRALAREAAQEFIDALRSLDRGHYSGQPCSVFTRRVSALQQRMLLRLQIRQRRYDERTGFGAQQGAVLVLDQPVVCSRRRAGISRSCSATAWPPCECLPAARSPRPGAR